MICASCGRAFEAKRADARYCGAACRKRASRCVTDNVTDVTAVTDNQQDDSDGERELQCKLLEISELFSDDEDRLWAARRLMELATDRGRALLSVIASSSVARRHR
jgi:hypothetical protein